MRCICKTTINLIILIFSYNFNANSFAETLTFGIVPQQSAKKLAVLWTPIMKHISQETGYTVRFSTAKDIPTFEKRCAEGAYDIAYMNPYHYVVFGDQPGYRALAKQKDKKIKGIIVIAKDSNISELAQLTGKTLAFPAPAAFAASIIPRAELAKAGVEFTPKYVSSHDSVYLNVAKGFMVAGGGVMRTFNNTNPEVKSNLKILWNTQPYTPHAIATHDRISETVRKKLLNALLSMSDSESSRELLKGIHFKAFEKAQHNDWDDVRALNIQPMINPLL